MKALILGGTSFFGKEIARLFYEAGHDVALFTRGNQIPSDLPPHLHIKGERASLEDLRRAATTSHWDVVIDNIAYTGADVTLALEAFRQVKRYLLCSTVSVYRYVVDPFPQPLRENAVDFSYRPPTEDLNDVHWKYARGKLEAELALIGQDRVKWTIVRPPVVYGPYDVTDRGAWYVGRLLKGGPILLGNGGANSFRLAYSVDVARSFLQIAERENTLGGIYNVAQEEVITLKDFIEESARALGITPTLVSVPTELLGDLAGPYSTMTNFIPAHTAARRDFDFRATPWTKWAASTAQWIRDHWKGDEKRLFETRPRELAFAEQWRLAMAKLSPPLPAD